ncbi:hypothetical protein KUV46_02390 [Thalassovita mediterranea]|nr:hypothetical protein KUV46_02390 [Thalassovita mediterranea]
MKKLKLFLVALVISALPTPMLAQAPSASVCHPALDRTLDIHTLRLHVLGSMSAEKLAPQLDPGNGSVTAETVRTAYALYVVNNLGVERLLEVAGAPNVHGVVRVLANCVAAEGGTPAMDCGLPPNSNLFRRSQTFSQERNWARAAMKTSFDPAYGPETVEFLAANLGSCVLEPGRLKSDAEVAADAYAATQAPRPVEECWQVAGTIQSFIDNPGYSYSSSGMSYERSASASERDWLSKWKTRVANGNPQCVADYPKRILTLSRQIQRQRQSAAAAEEKRYRLSRANQGPSAEEIFQRWDTMNSAYRRCIELYGDCRWVEE